VLTLGACQDTFDSPTPGAWLLACVVVAALAGLAHAWGRQMGRAGAARELREARATARLWRGLQDAHVWRTDAAHRLVSWQGPGLPATDRCALFDDAAAPADPATQTAPGISRSLRAQVPFGGLHLHGTDAIEGARHWELAGAPQHDDRGAFTGFVGTARAVDTLDGQNADAAALPALLACDDAVVIVAAVSQQTWRIRHTSRAARALWPGLDAETGLDAVLAGMPQPARDAAQRLLMTSAATAHTLAQPPASGESVAGWRFEPFGPLPDGGAGVVLAQRTPGLAGAAATSAQASASADNADSEQFSFTVSHDLRAPIRVVEGFTRIVKEDYGRLLDRVGNDHLDRVLGAAARMNLMIDALLTLAKLSTQPLAQQTVNLSQMAGWVAEELTRNAPERQAEIDIEPGLTSRGDPTLLRLVLENLLGNAWKYSARCAKSQISLRRVPHGNGTAYVVRDNGAGFDMRSADRLFGLFQRLHSASEFPGHGVGLASVRRIVRRHGGEIWAEAEAGRGAAFYFTLGN
jgi:signal transduction histidine kinase